jgi:hypothetical protein
VTLTVCVNRYVIGLTPGPEVLSATFEQIFSEIHPGSEALFQTCAVPPNHAPVRLTKDYQGPIVFHGAGLDLDRTPHEPWPDEDTHEDFFFDLCAKWSTGDLPKPQYYYPTTRGARVVFKFDQPHDSPEYQEQILDNLIAKYNADPACKDWTRLFKVPTLGTHGGPIALQGPAYTPPPVQPYTAKPRLASNTRSVALRNEPLSKCQPETPTSASQQALAKVLPLILLNVANADFRALLEQPVEVSTPGRDETLTKLAAAVCDAALNTTADYDEAFDIGWWAYAEVIAQQPAHYQPNGSSDGRKKYVSAWGKAVQLREEAATRPPILLCAGAYFVKDGQGNYRPDPILKQNHLIAELRSARSPVRTRTAKGKDLSIQEVVNSHAIQVTFEVLDGSIEHPIYDHVLSTLRVPIHRRTKFEPMFDDAVDEWARLFAGGQYPEFESWLAHALARDTASHLPLLALIGPGGAGKSLTGQALGQAFVYGANKGTALMKFNEGLIHSPIVHLEEGVPKRGRYSEGNTVSQVVREMLGSTNIEVQRKNRPNATVNARVRIILTANSSGGLETLLDGGMREADLRVMEERILEIDVQQAAADWIKRGGGEDGVTKGWLDGDHKLVRHLLWLSENRLNALPYKGRFAVPGNFRAKHYLARGEVGALVTATLAQCLQQNGMPGALGIGRGHTIHGLGVRLGVLRRKIREADSHVSNSDLHAAMVAQGFREMRWANETLVFLDWKKLIALAAELGYDVSTAASAFCTHDPHDMPVPV